MFETHDRYFSLWVLAWLLALVLALFACGCTEGHERSDSVDGPAVSQQDDSSDVAGLDDEPSQTDANQQTGESSSDANQQSGASESNDQQVQDASSEELSVTENGTYTTKDEVALYIHMYGHLPSNFISKTKAKQAGWVASEGNLDEVCPGKSIGGSQFYNDDGLLPEASGRTWKECDINYHGGYRGAERIVFSNDGLIYYTGNHYSSFERLY